MADLGSYSLICALVVAVLGMVFYLLPPAALGVFVACLLVRGFSA